MTAVPSTGTPGKADIRRAVADVVTMKVGREVNPSIDLFDQGVTSLAFIRAIGELTDRYGVELDVTDLEEASVDALVELLDRQLSTQQPATARDGR
jgi:acyl carrier protein